MSHMGDHEHERPVELDDVPEGEDISPADAAERIDEEQRGPEQPSRPGLGRTTDHED